MNYESSIDILKIMKETRFDEIKVKQKINQVFPKYQRIHHIYEISYNEFYLSYLPTEKDRKTKVIQK